MEGYLSSYSFFWDFLGVFSKTFYVYRALLQTRFIILLIFFVIFVGISRPRFYNFFEFFV